MAAVDQKEVEALYWRFRSLDRGRKGFVTEDELLAIPGNGSQHHLNRYSGVRNRYPGVTSSQESRC